MAEDTASPATYRAPGPVDPFLEPLVWSIASDWPSELERIRRGEKPAKTPLARAGQELTALHAEATAMAANAPFGALQPGPVVERFARVWNAVGDNLDEQLKWLSSIRPDQTDYDHLSHADFVVQLGQVMRAAQFRVLGRKLSDLDYLRGYAAQMQADWKPIAQQDATHWLAPGIAVDRYNWLLRRAKFIVVKKSQHIAQLDELNVAELKRSAAVLDYSLMHLVRGVAFA